jgi:hypothetical protein
VAPSFLSMHELGATIPNECKVAMNCTFITDNLTGLFQIPSYYQWLMQADQRVPYAYYKRMLKLLQWKNPRRYWLLKSPSHIESLPVLFDVFPDARVVYAHRDPVKARASVTHLLGTLYWMRSDKAFDAASFERLMTPEAYAGSLNRVIDQIESGQIPRAQIHDFLFADLMRDPLDAISGLYQAMGIEFPDQGRQAVSDYLAHKPKGKFGQNVYSVGDPEAIALERAIFARYQAFHKVTDEV